MKSELSLGVIEKYQVRKNKKQKEEFRGYITSNIPEAKVESHRISNNIIIGDPSKAKVIFTAHYDTCARMIVPNFATPKNLITFVGYQAVLTIGIFAIAYLFQYLFTLWLGEFAGFLAFEAVVFAIVILMIAGPANKHTMNDNTSGVLTLLEIYKALPKDKLNEVCLVMLDNEELGLFGSAAFKRKHYKDLKGKLVINFDCVSDGDTLMFVINKGIYSSYKSLFQESFKSDNDNKEILITSSINTVYPSDQLHFSTGVGVAALKKAPLVGYYLDKIHTDKDRVLDELNI